MKERSSGSEDIQKRITRRSKELIKFAWGSIYNLNPRQLIFDRQEYSYRTGRPVKTIFFRKIPRGKK